MLLGKMADSATTLQRCYGSDRLKLNLAAGYLFRIRSVVQVDIPSHEGNLQESVCLGALVQRGVSLVLGGR